MREGSEHAKSTVKCDALLVDTVSRSDTYPYVDVREDDVEMGHEASVSKISEDQPFYLMSRGMTEDEAMATIVRGFVEPIARELLMEYALELNRLIELQMEGGSASALTRGLFLLCALAAKVLPVAGDVLAVVVGALWYTSALWYDNGFHLPAP